MIELTQPNGVVTTFDCDGNSNPIATTGSRNVQILRAFNAFNKVTQITVTRSYIRHHDSVAPGDHSFAWNDFVECCPDLSRAVSRVVSNILPQENGVFSLKR